MDILAFLRETVFVFLIIFLMSNWALGQLAADEYSWAVSYKGAIKMLKVAFFFTWLSFIGWITKGYEFFGWSIDLLVVPLMALYALYYFQSALNNGVHLTGTRFQILDDFDRRLKNLFNKAMPETVAGLPEDPLQGMTSTLDLTDELRGLMEGVDEYG